MPLSTRRRSRAGPDAPRPPSRLTVTKTGHEWSTGDELAFLAALGTRQWSSSMAGPLPARLVLLRRYQAAMRCRVDWGSVDPARVATTVAILLLREETL